MRTIGYTTFWEMVDAIDEYIDGDLSRATYRGLMGDEFHYPRIKAEWKRNPTTAIKAMILLRWQQEDDILVCIRPKEWLRINTSTSLESIMAMVKSRYGRNKVKTVSGTHNS